MAMERVGRPMGRGVARDRGKSAVVEIGDLCN